MEVFRFDRDYDRIMSDIKDVEAGQKWALLGMNGVCRAWANYCKSNIKPATGE